jgi:hypothetical protein
MRPFDQIASGERAALLVRRGNGARTAKGQKGTSRSQIDLTARQRDAHSTASSAIFSVIGRIRPRRQVEHYPRLGVELPEFAARC